MMLIVTAATAVIVFNISIAGYKLMKAKAAGLNHAHWMKLTEIIQNKTEQS